MMTKGAMGRIMIVDLSENKISTEPVSHRVYETFLSGMGLAAYLLYNRIPAGAGLYYEMYQLWKKEMAVLSFSAWAESFSAVEDISSEDPAF